MTTFDFQRPPGKLVLADGTTFSGNLFGGDSLPVWGELVFNTAMTGYQEVITDPSYAGQIVVMTYPQIGNYGVNPSDDERNRCAARGLVVRDFSEFYSPGQQRSGLGDYMRDRGLVGITGVDTRALTTLLRSQGATVAAIGGDAHSVEQLQGLAAEKSTAVQQLVRDVADKRVDSGATSGPRIKAALVDMGVKQNIADSLVDAGAEVAVWGMDFAATDLVASGCDAVVLSNGPGDPTDIAAVVDQVKQLVGKVPVLGICLGHQVLALALGGSTFKMKFGHHGANHPVIDRDTKRVYISSQNHSYAVADDIAEKAGVKVTFVNAADGTVEGFRDDNRMVESVQFHPEASPGPHDTQFIFEKFVGDVERWRAGTNA